SGAKNALLQRHKQLLDLRYDLSDKPVAGVTMTRGKPIQGGVRAKLPAGMDWQRLASMTPDQIRADGVFPAGFLPLPHPNHDEGGMLFPQHHIDEINRQEKRDLTRFDLDFDLPTHLLPEFPPAIFLTTRPDLGDVSQGELVTNQNFFRLFSGVLTPKQLDGVRLLTSPFAQQQFNLTSDRRSLQP
ncbi:MAG: cytochrome B6, partial [Candidatus Binatia bacterium]